MKKFGQLMACLLPSVLFLGINIVVSIIVEVVAIVGFFTKNGGSPDGYMDFVLNLAMDKDFLLKVTIAFQLVALIVGIIIYYFAFKEKNIENPGKVIGGPGFVYIVALFVGCAMFIGFLLNEANVFFPDIMKGYQEMIEKTGLGDMSLFSTIATLVMAPLAEEVFFRGMTFKFARKFTKSFWAANIIQAALFGFVHLNLVQGLYAFLLGIVLGLIYKRFNSLYASMLAHLTFNFTGTYLTNWIFGNENMYALKLAITTTISVVLIVGCLYLIFKDKKSIERNALFVARHESEYALANAPVQVATAPGNTASEPVFDAGTEKEPQE